MARLDHPHTTTFAKPPQLPAERVIENWSRERRAHCPDFQFEAPDPF